MITPAFVQTMAAYNAEMNRRIYAAAGKMTDAERQQVSRLISDYIAKDRA